VEKRLPSRDRVKEKREQRQLQVGFSKAKPQERFVLYGVFRIVFSYVYAGANGDKHVYVGSLKDRHVHLKKCADLGRTVDHTLPGLFAVVFLSMGHYPCYRSPNFSIIKLFSALVFLPGFFPGASTKKYWCL
jgi:hypothetical protein